MNSDHKMIRSSDGGRTWEWVENSKGDWISLTCSESGQLCFAVKVAMEFRYSTEVNPRMMDKHYVDHYKYDDSIYMSQDFGKTWNVVPRP